MAFDRTTPPQEGEKVTVTFEGRNLRVDFFPVPFFVGRWVWPLGDVLLQRTFWRSCLNPGQGVALAWVQVLF